MAGWAERKLRALGRIHRTFERPAVYLTHAAGVPIPVDVRIHQRHVIEAKSVDDWSHAGDMMELHDRIIFDRRQVADVLQNSYVFYKRVDLPLEIYITGASKPEREGYVWVEVSPLDATDIAALLAQIDPADYPDVWEGILT